MRSEDWLSACVQEMRDLEVDGIVVLGDAPQAVHRFWTVRDEQLILTEERYRHILERHPELDSLWREAILTLLDPDELHRNQRDASMVIFIKALPGGSHYLRAAVLLSEREGRQHSLITAWKLRAEDYRRMLRRGTRLWERGT